MQLQKLIDELQPYDIAIIYTDLPLKFKSRFLMFLNNHLLADVIQEIEDTNLQYELLHKLSPDKKVKF